MTKDGRGAPYNGIITYGIDFNPESKQIGSGENVLLKDQITIGDYIDDGTATSYVASDVTVELESVNVYKVNNSEPVDIGHLITNPSAEKGDAVVNFSSIFDMAGYSEVEGVTAKDPNMSNSKGKKIIPVQAGDRVTFEINITYDAIKNSNNKPNFYYFFKSNDIGTDVNSVNDQNAQALPFDLFKKDDENNYTLEYTVTIPNNNEIKYLQIEDWATFFNTLNSVNVIKLERPAKHPTANLELTVPDRTHLYIEYKYTVRMQGTENKENQKLKASNKVSVSSEFASGSAEKNDVEISLDKSEASSSTYGAPKIYKTNVGNVNIKNLDAKFTLAKYETGGWKSATAFDIDKDGISTPKYETGTAKEFNTVNGDKIGFQVNLEAGKLYRLTETQAPAGFRKPEGDAADYYFIYQGTLDSVSKPADLNVNMIKSVNGDITIKNIKNIDIEASKVVADDPETVKSVEFTLFWSYDNIPGGMPTDDKLHPLSELTGIQGNAVQTITDLNNGKAEWKNLPNGIYNAGDYKPIYYYVKETAYTVDNVTYKLNDGVYKSESGEIGSYKPSYSRNSINDNIKDENGTENPANVVITNSKGLKVRKIWTDSANNEITSEDKIPASAIKFTLYGMDTPSGEKTKIGEELIITAENNWAVDVNSDVGNYKYYTAEETFVQLKGEEEFKSVDVGLYMYGRSANIIKGSIGEIRITNKNNTPTSVDVTVVKEWADGNNTHDSDEISVTLYYATSSLTADEIKNIGNSIPDKLTSVPTDFAPETSGLTFNAVKLNKDNNWTYTWDNLPYKAENGGRYYYYVLETLPEESKYVASYKFSNSSSSRTVITNSVPGSVNIEKSWDGINGDDYDSITFEVYQKVKDDINSPRSFVRTFSADTDNRSKLKNIFALGDSITKGTFGGYVQDIYTYPEVLKSKLNNSQLGYNNVSVTKVAEDGRKINDIKSASQYSNVSTADVICIIAGTNDIVNSNDSIDTMITNLTSLVNSVKTDNNVVFLGSVPRFKALTWSNSRENIEGSLYGANEEKKAAVQKQWDDLVDAYNAKVKEVAKNTGVYFVDVNKAVGENLADGCHPDDVGYANIAQYFYNVIDEYYTTGTVTTDGSEKTGSSTENPVETPENADSTTLNNDFWNAISDYKLTSFPTGVTISAGNVLNADGTITVSKTGGWNATIKGLPEKDENGNDYIYYFKEVSVTKNGEIKSLDDAQIKSVFTGNGVKSGSNTIKFTNSDTNTGSLEIEKDWYNDTPEKRPSEVKVRLMRTITPENQTASLDDFVLVPKAVSINDADNGTSFTIGANSHGTIGIDATKEIESIVFEVSSNGNSGNVDIGYDYYDAGIYGYISKKVGVLYINNMNYQHSDNTNQYWEKYEFVNSTFTIVPKNDYKNKPLVLVNYSNHDVNISYTINYAGGGSSQETETTTQSIQQIYTTTTPTQPINAERQPVNVPGKAETVETITLSSSDNWHYTAGNLPLTDADGNTYYYYIQELDDNGNVISNSGTVSGNDAKYIPVQYLNNGITADSGRIMRVTNAETEENSGVEMPSTGGAGTLPYTVCGMLMTGGALALLSRRRRKSA